MAGKSPYSDEQRAAVYVALRANDGNVKRTARETRVPENTVRRWKQEWSQGLAVPSVEAVVKKANEFADEAEQVRDLALRTLVEKIPDARPSELITIVGVLDDKITRAKGLDRDRNLNVNVKLPSSEEIQALIGGFINTAIEAASDDVIDGEFTEAPTLALPSTT